jgi:hypothetical protein
VPEPVISDAEVEQAVNRGAAYLGSRQLPDGNFPADGKDTVGPSLLAALALLKLDVAQPIKSPMAKLLTWLGEQKLDSVEQSALRCRVWAAAGDEPRYSKPLRADAVTVLRSKWQDDELPAAVAGIAAVDLAGQEVPQVFWTLAARRLEARQNPDGGWGPQGRASDALITARTLLALQLCYDSLFQDRFIQCGRHKGYPAVEAGLRWMDASFRAELAGPARPASFYAWLHEAARLGQATGRWSFGGADWARAGTAALLGRQKADGSWPGRSPEAATAQALLFLAEARRPVLLLKLQYAGNWNNRPHALGNLASWLSRDAGFPPWHFAWRVIDGKQPVDRWPAAQVLLVTGDQPIVLNPVEMDALRTFVDRGGTILSIVEGDGQAFDAAIRGLYAQLWPSCKPVPCPPQHELNHVRFRLQNPVPVEVVSNGVRPLAIHYRQDLMEAWQLDLHLTRRDAFHVAGNVLTYVTDSDRMPRWPAPPAAQARAVVPIARLEHAGNWDPEPLAYERFARLLLAETGIEVRHAPVAVAALGGSGAKLASLTGTGTLQLEDADKAALKQFVEAGGTLVVDAAGGDGGFADSARALIRDLWGPRSLRRLAPAGPVFKLKGHQIDRVLFRRRTRIRLGRIMDPNLYVVLLGGREAVFFSAEDITAGLVGFPSYTIDGYAPESAYRLLRNMVLRAAGG